MYKNKLRYLMLAAACAMLLLPVLAFAGGPLLMWNPATRTPFRYQGTVPVYTDLGNLGIIQNARAGQLTGISAAQWSGVATSTFRAQVMGDFASRGLPDITAANAQTVIGQNNGGGIYVIYDTDGTIIQNFFGASQFSTLGIASPEFGFGSTPQLTESWVVINGRSVNAADAQGNIYNGVITHEFGHAINLAHSQTNGSLLTLTGDRPGPGACNPLPYPTTSFLTDIETMFPFINVGTGATTSTGAAMATVDRKDDQAALSDLYPAANWPQVAGSISGRIFFNDGTEATGYNLVARNVADPFADSNSSIAGDRTRGFIGRDGTFRINGLTPGAQYVLYFDGIFRGGFPTGLPFLLGPEEFFNGPNESGNGETDPPCDATPLTMTAGLNQTANITLNRVQGAPEFTQIAIGFVGNDISDDGTKVVGSGLTGPPSFLWTEGVGAVSLGGAGGNSTTISGDGNLITGNFSVNGFVRASRWIGGTNWEPFPAPPGAGTCDSTASSNWGTGANSSSGLYYIGGCARPRTYFWNGATNTTTIMDFPTVPANATGTQARTNGMSADGGTLAGWIVCSPTQNAICQGSQRQGVIWNSATGGLTDFSSLRGSFVGEAYSANSNGSIVAGIRTGTNNGNGWIWRRATNSFTLIPALPVPNPLSNPALGAVLGISDDGNVAIGNSSVPSAGAFLPTIWTPELGNVNFDTFVQAQGTSLFEWVSLRTPTAITPDGTAIAGLGLGPPGTNLGAYRIKMNTAIVCFNTSAGARTLRVPFPLRFRRYLAAGATVGLCPAATIVEEDPGLLQ